MKILCGIIFILLGIVSLYGTGFVVKFHHEDWYGFPTFMMLSLGCIGASIVGLGLILYGVEEKWGK